MTVCRAGYGFPAAAQNRTGRRSTPPSATPARILVPFTPAGMEHFFDRFAALTPTALGPDAFRSIGAEVGMDVLGPPLRQEHV